MDSNGLPLQDYLLLALKMLSSWPKSIPKSLKQSVTRWRKSKIIHAINERISWRNNDRPAGKYQRE